MNIETLLLMIVVAMCPLSLFVGVIGTLLVVPMYQPGLAQQQVSPIRVIAHGSMDEFKYITKISKRGAHNVAENMSQRGWEVELITPRNGYYDVTFRKVLKSRYGNTVIAV